MEQLEDLQENLKQSNGAAEIEKSWRVGRAILNHTIASCLIGRAVRIEVILFGHSSSGGSTVAEGFSAICRLLFGEEAYLPPSLRRR
jgi:hypothetical protein